MPHNLDAGLVFVCFKLRSPPSIALRTSITIILCRRILIGKCRHRFWWMTFDINVHNSDGPPLSYRPIQSRPKHLAIPAQQIPLLYGNKLRQTASFPFTAIYIYISSETVHYTIAKSSEAIKSTMDMPNIGLCSHLFRSASSQRYRIFARYLKRDAVLVVLHVL